MTHYFFSPHPDDAALSCGGQIAQLRQQGESVLVITAMAGDPPPILEAALTRRSPQIVELWQRWGLGTGRVVSNGRRIEDRAAMAKLGAQVIFWPWLDAIYRQNTAGVFIYGLTDAIFADIQATDPLLAEIKAGPKHPLISPLLARLQPGDTLHSPLGVGAHVDHRLVRDLLLLATPDLSRQVTLVFYEEYPYSAPDYKGTATVTVVKKALDQTAEQLQKQGVSVAEPVSIVHQLDSIAINAKIAAIDSYHSQLSSFWVDSAAMADSVRRYSDLVGGEREWHFRRDDGLPKKE